MGTHCTRCEGTGFLNIHQLPDGLLDEGGVDAVLAWLEKEKLGTHDVDICDCCGDGDGSWNYEPGAHHPEEQVFDCM